MQLIGGRRSAARRRPAALLAVLLGASLAGACAAPAPEAPPAGRRVVVDDAGVPVSVPLRPRRIACLSPDLTETAFDVGAGEHVVAACDPCDQPPAAAALPKLGPMDAPSIEALLLVRPDLVLATGDGNPLAAVTRMRELGLPVFGLKPEPGLAGVARQVRRVGEVVGKPLEAERLAGEMERRVAAVRERHGSGRRLRACILVWTDPLIAAGRDSYLTDLAASAGADNACATGDGWPAISRETVLLARPEVVLLAMADPGDGLGAWAAELPAVARGAVLVLPEHPFLRPSARLGAAAEELERLLAPWRTPP